MARLSKSALLDRLLSAIEEGGGAALVEEASHPFVLRVSVGDAFVRTRVYVWNVTHGGGKARAANEYRIQVTGVDSFSVTGVDRTVVLGWWEEGSVFAAWDVTKHLSPLGQSPSLQVHAECLREAAANQVATQTKGNDEIVVAFSPPFVTEYISQLRILHQMAGSPTDLAALASIAADPIETTAAVASATSPQRRVALTQVARKLRDTSFSERVLRAYANRCAMCGVQLKLVDAAHIVPVAYANNDQTCNGVALCALHHRAFDRALVTMDEKYRIALNPDRLDSLAAEDRIRGIKHFRKNLRAILDLPPTIADRPQPDLIAQANSIRGWKRFEKVH